MEISTVTLSQECIHRSLLCDGRSNCQNGIDELPQFCHNMANFYTKNDKFSLLTQMRNPFVLATFLMVTILIMALPVYCFCYLAKSRKRLAKKRNRQTIQLTKTLPNSEIAIGNEKAVIYQPIFRKNADNEMEMYNRDQVRQLKFFFKKPGNLQTNFLSLKL